MTTITATFTGKASNFDMFLTCGIRNASTVLKGNSLTVSWICEDQNKETVLENVMEDINLKEMESWGLQLISLN